MTAAANGRARPSCARAKRNSPSAAPTIAWRAAIDRTGFFEVDTGEQPSWTVQLTESADQVPMQPLQSRVPMLQTPPAGRPAGTPPPPSRSQELMRRLRRTKIVATLGPASSDRSVIASLFDAGADVFRINMSHTTHERMRELVATIRSVESEHGRPIGILVDLQGPKLRVGSFDGGPVMLVKGETFTLDADPRPATPARVHLPHPEIFAAIEPGHTLLLDDGKVRLTATEVDDGRIVTRVEVGGKLSDRKGVSLPDTTIPFSALAEKDRSDLEAALDTGIDWVALSFIQRPEDIAEAKKITRGRAAVMAKIEKPQAVHAARRDHGCRRRADGGARRSRRRNAAREGAGRAEADDARGAARRQAGRGRDPDAGIDDREPGADARRSVRRRDRHLRGRRRRSCCRRNPRPGNIRSKRSPP